MSLYIRRPDWRGAERHEYTCRECGCISIIDEPCWYCAEQKSRDDSEPPVDSPQDL